MKTNLKIISFAMTFLFILSGASTAMGQTGQQKDVTGPLELVHKDSTMVAHVDNINEFLTGVEQFSRLGFGAFGGMLLTKLRQGLKKSWAVDPFSSTSLYVSGIAPNKGAALAVLGNPQANVKSKSALVLPIRNKKSFDQLLFQLFQKSRGAGKYEIVKTKGKPYVRAGNSFVYQYFGDYAVIARTPSGLELIRQARQQQTSLAEHTTKMKTFNEMAQYDLRIYLGTQSLDKIMKDFTATLKRKQKGRGKRSAPFLSGGFDLYDTLNYGLSFGAEGVYGASIVKLSDKAMHHGMDRLYVPLQKGPSTDPRAFLQKDPLFFMETGVAGKPLMKFLGTFLLAEGKAWHEQGKELDEFLTKFKEKVGVDLEENLIQNIYGPIQFYVNNIKPPWSPRQIKQTDSFLSMAILDKNKIHKLMDAFVEFVAKKNKESKNEDGTQKPEITFTKGKKSGHWILRFYDQALGQESVAVHFRQKKGKLFVSLASFALDNFTSPKADLTRQDYLMGIAVADKAEYGDIVALYSLNFGRIEEIIDSYMQNSSQKGRGGKNFIIAQIKAVLKNYEDLVGVTRQDGRWMRSWVHLNLKGN